jgi:exosortase A
MTAVDPIADMRRRDSAASTATGMRDALLVPYGLIAVAVVVFWPSLQALAALWSDPARRTYQHGYVIAAISLWLVFRERRRIAAAIGPWSPWMLLAAVAGGLAWAVAWNAGLQVVHFLIWPAVLWAAMTGVLGVGAGRVLLIPVAFLFFAMPIWDVLTPVLQWGTIAANRVLAVIGNMPVIIERNVVHIPEGSFEIAGGCSGLNYLIVGLAIATLLGEVNRDGRERRLLLIALGGGMAIVSNWLRVFIIIYAGHVSDMQHYLVKVDHYNFGWVLYAFVLAAFFLVVRRLPESKRGEPPVPADGVARSWLPVAAAALALSSGPLLVQASALAARQGSTGQVGVSSLDFDDRDAWRAMPASGDWVPVFPGADAESLVEFSRGEDLVTVYTATFLKQQQGHELIGHDSLVQGNGRGVLGEHGTRRIAGEPANEVIEAQWRDAGGGRAVIWWTYQVGHRQFTRPLAAQLWYGVMALAGRPVSSVVVMRARCTAGCESARASLEAFASESLADLLAASGSSGE